ncbi:MAG: ubiquitin-like domain-containing protein [Clostridia bacterium]|nr:ubiquitin-like domain-containing protein [Clostridia bacterium]
MQGGIRFLRIRSFWHVSVVSLFQRIAGFFRGFKFDLRPAKHTAGRAQGRARSSATRFWQFVRPGLAAAYGGVKYLLSAAVAGFLVVRREIRILRYIYRHQHRNGPATRTRFHPKVFLRALRIRRHLAPQQAHQFLGFGLARTAMVLAVVFSASILLGSSIRGGTFSRKYVTVNFDGYTVEISSRAATVGEMLDEFGVHLGEHDATIPGRSEPYKNNEEIHVYRARGIWLQADGEIRRVYVAPGQTVADMLEDNGIVLGHEDILSDDPYAELLGGEWERVARVEQDVNDYKSRELEKKKGMDSS